LLASQALQALTISLFDAFAAAVPNERLDLQQSAEVPAEPTAVPMHDFLGVAPPPNLIVETRKRIRTSSDGLGRFSRALLREMEACQQIKQKESFELVLSLSASLL
jgi:hypothetical protein